MATFVVQLEVNVPGLGSRTFTTAPMVTATIEEAMAQAKAGIIVAVIQVQRTAP